MPEDPAITRAKQLWNQKQPKDAMILLINRVNELNQMVALLQQRAPAEYKETGLVQWGKLGRAALGVILIIILLIMCGILYR